MADPATVVAVASAITDILGGLFGGAAKRKRAKLELNTLLAQLSLEEQALALEYANTFIQGQEVELQAAFNEWQSEFQIAQLKEENRQRSIDRAIARDTTIAGLEKESDVAKARFEYSQKAEKKARQSWAVREGLLDEQHAKNIGLINETEALQSNQLRRAQIRHDARLIVESASSNLINRHLGQIRGDQAAVYQEEIGLVKSSAAHNRAEEIFSLRIQKLEADERLVAFELNKDLALSEYNAAIKHREKIKQIHTMTETELENLDAWSGSLSDIIDGSDDGQDGTEGRVDEITDDLADTATEAISETLEEEAVKSHPLYQRYSKAVQSVRNNMLRFGPTRQSGQMVRYINEALSAEAALKAALGVQTLSYDDAGEYVDWKPAALDMMLKAAQGGKWAKDNDYFQATINQLQAAGAEQTGDWWSQPGVIARAQRIQASNYWGGKFTSRQGEGYYSDQGLGAQGRVERSVALSGPGTDAGAPPQTDTNPAAQGSNYYGPMAQLENPAAGMPATQVAGRSAIDEAIANPPTGGGGSFAIGADGEAVPFVGANDPSNDQRARSLTPDTGAVTQLKARWNLRTRRDPNNLWGI